jgi:hypothetical protein
MELRSLNEAFPTLTKLYKLSEKSLEGRDLWVFQVSAQVNFTGPYVCFIKFW